jgi:hypothetical protein
VGGCGSCFKGTYRFNQINHEHTDEVQVPAPTMNAAMFRSRSSGIPRLKDESVLGYVGLIDENRAGDFAHDQPFIKKCLIELYMKVFSRQMKSICAYYQQQGNLFMQDLPPLSDWKEIEDLRTKEWQILNLTAKSTASPMVDRLQGLADTATSDETKLRDIHLSVAATVCTVCGNLDPRKWEEKYRCVLVLDIQHTSLVCPACMVLVRGVSAIVKAVEERSTAMAICFGLCSERGVT